MLSDANIASPIQCTIDNEITPTATTISHSNWTEWSTIQGVIERVISKFEIMTVV